MDNKTKGKDYIIFAKSSEVKSKWMDAFRREKERVAQDKASGIAGSGSGVHKGSHTLSLCVCRVQRVSKDEESCSCPLFVHRRCRQRRQEEKEFQQETSPQGHW